MQWLSDGPKLLALTVIGAVLVGAWMFRYEPLGQFSMQHRNRITGAICPAREECWFN